MFVKSQLKGVRVTIKRSYIRRRCCSPLFISLCLGIMYKVLLVLSSISRFEADCNCGFNSLVAITSTVLQTTLRSILQIGFRNARFLGTTNICCWSVIIGINWLACWLFNRPLSLLKASYNDHLSLLLLLLLGEGSSGIFIPIIVFRFHFFT